MHKEAMQLQLPGIIFLTVFYSKVTNIKMNMQVLFEGGPDMRKFGIQSVDKVVLMFGCPT